MKSQLQHLLHIAEQEERIILGLMSGTSLDGLDLALCRFRGNGENTNCELLQFKTHSYSSAQKNKLQSIAFRDKIELKQLCLLHTWLGKLHAAMINQMLEEWHTPGSQVDLIASHGQTVYHAPASQHTRPNAPNATFQIGEADHIAVDTGIVTISDFRQKHVAAGGEGAPLAAFGDRLLFADKQVHRIMLNIGGISNFTLLPPTGMAKDVIATDTGPGNTLLDQLIQNQLPDKAYDENGAIASRGTIHTALLKALKDHSFFTLPLPKTTGPELFNIHYFENAKSAAGIQKISIENSLATLVRFTVDTISESIHTILPASAHCEVYVSGGGVANTFLMQSLRSALRPVPLRNFSNLGFPSGAKEALLFAALANETIAGERPVAGVQPAVSMGKISFPK